MKARYLAYYYTNLPQGSKRPGYYHADILMSGDNPDGLLQEALYLNGLNHRRVLNYVCIVKESAGYPDEVIWDFEPLKIAPTL